MGGITQAQLKNKFHLECCAQKKQFCLELYWPALGSHWKTGTSFVATHMEWVGDLWSHNFRRLWQRNNIFVVCSRSGVGQKQDIYATETLLKRALSRFYCQFLVPFEIQDLQPSWTLISSEPDQKYGEKLEILFSRKKMRKKARKIKGWMLTMMSSVDYSKVLMCSFYYETVVTC